MGPETLYFHVRTRTLGYVWLTYKIIVGSSPVFCFAFSCFHATNVIACLHGTPPLHNSPDWSNFMVEAWFLWKLKYDWSESRYPLIYGKFTKDIWK